MKRRCFYLEKKIWKYKALFFIEHTVKENSKGK